MRFATSVICGTARSHRDAIPNVFASPEQKAAREEYVRRVAEERRADHERQRQAILARLEAKHAD